MSEIPETTRIANPDVTKGEYVPVTSAGGPPPGDQALAQHPQAQPTSAPVPQTQPQAAQQQQGGRIP